MFDLNGFEPHYHDPGKERIMDVDAETDSQMESGSSIISDSQVPFLLEHNIYPLFTEYVTVTCARAQYWLKFPVDYFGEKATLGFISI